MDSIYLPSVDYFKSMFKMFSYSSETNSEDASIVDEKFLTEQLINKTQEVKQMITNSDLPEPTLENGYPYISIKNYICFEVARLLTVNFASNSDLIVYIREESKRLKEEVIDNLSNITISPKSYESIKLGGDVKKP